MAQRVSLQGDKLAKSVFGIQEGIVRIFGGLFRVSGTGKEKDGTPKHDLVLQVARVDPKTFRMTDAELTEQRINVCWGSKATVKNADGSDTGRHAFRFWPATIKDASDNNIVEQGVHSIDGNALQKAVELDVTGNCLVSEDGAPPFENSEIGLFMKGLEAKGFKPEINAQGFAPAYIDTVIEVKSVPLTDLCKALGVKYREPEAPKPGEKARDPFTGWAVLNILNRGYENKLGDGLAPGAKTTTAATGANGAVASTPGAAVTLTDTQQANLVKAAATFAKEHAGKTVTMADVKKGMTAKLIPAEAKGGVGAKIASALSNSLFKDPDALTALLMEATENDPGYDEAAGSWSL